MQVLLALSGSMGRSIMSQWLRKNGMFTWEASEWNELTQILGQLFRARSSVPNGGLVTQCLQSEPWKTEAPNIQDMKASVFVIIVDIGLLDWSTDIWREQLNFLDKYHGKARFAWILNHDTSNFIKMELRRKGHLLMVNKPLYKSKVAHIVETVIKERDLEMQRKILNGLKSTRIEGDLHESVEIDSTHFEGASSDDSDRSEMGSHKSVNGYHIAESQKDRIRKPCPSQHQTANNCLVEFTQVYSTENNLETGAPGQIRPNSHGTENEGHELLCNKRASPLTEAECKNSRCQEQHLNCTCPTEQGDSYSGKTLNGQKSLEGLRILLAEDTPVLQRVATIMLEKMGATVIAVGDGMQAVDALKCMLGAVDCGGKCLVQDGRTRCQTQICDSLPYDLILMDCQVRNS